MFSAIQLYEHDYLTLFQMKTPPPLLVYSKWFRSLNYIKPSIL